MSGTRAALVVRRGVPATRAAVAGLAHQHQFEVSVVYESASGGAMERTLCDAHGLAWEVLVVPALSDLASTPVGALRVVEAIAALGLNVFSVEEAWLAANVATVAEVARWFLAATQRARTAKGRATLAASGRAAGRPRRPVPLLEAEQLIAKGTPVAACARVLAIPETSLRRALKDKRTADRIAALTRSQPTEHA